MLTRLQIHALIGAIVASTSGCSNFSDKVSAVIFPAHPSSWHTRGERVEVSLDYRVPRQTVANAKTTAEQQEQVDAQSAAIGAAAAQLAIDAAVDFLEEEAKRYEASYSGIAVGDTFFDGWTSSAAVNLRRVCVQRSINNADTTAEDCKARADQEMDQFPAFYLELSVDPTLDQSSFQIRPSFLVLKQSKAKLHLFNWLEPWTWLGFGDSDNDLDLTVRVGLHSAWIDNRQGRHFEKLAEGQFKIRNAKFNTKYVQGSGSLAAGTKKLPAGDFEGQLIPVVPRSFLGQSPDGKGMLLGTGNFVLTVLVTEVDEYGEKIKEGAEDLKDQREGIVTQLTSLFE